MNTIQSVERALAILEGFSDAAPYLTAQEIAARARLPRPSVYRFLRTLGDRGFIVEVGDAEQRRYAVGPTVVGLSRLAFGQGELRRRAHPVMQLITERTGETTWLSVRYGMVAVCVESVEGTNALRYGGRVGYSYPLYAGSPKVILAYLEADLQEHIIRSLTFKPVTKATIRSRAELRRRIAIIRRRGFEISSGEMFVGTRAIGAPVFGASGEVIAVLSLGAPSGRITPRNQGKLSRIVMNGAEQITARHRKP